MAKQGVVDKAAEKVAGAIKESYQALADRSVSARELNAQPTQESFNGVIDNLGTRASNNRALANGLIEQQRKQQGPPGRSPGWASTPTWTSRTPRSPATGGPRRGLEEGKKVTEKAI